MDFLYKYANISQVESFEQDGDDIIIEVAIDDVVHRQYLKMFEEEKFEREKTRSTMTPPKGW